MNQHFRYTILAGAVMQAALLFSGSAQAQQQVPPTIGDALRQLPPPVVEKAAPSLPAVGNLPPPVSVQALPGDKVTVSRIDIEGNQALSGPELQAQVAAGVGQALTLAQLEELASNLTRYYRLQGYFVARAYLPAQEVTGGVVRIHVVEGHYGKFTLNNSSLVNDATLASTLNLAKAGGTVTQASLEGAMLAVNEMPGVVIRRADIMPGEQVGTSDFFIVTEPTARVDGYIAAENYGSEYTGRRRVMGGLSLNSPLGIGDKLSASGLLSNGRDLKNFRIAYALPLTARGLRAELAASRTDYQLAGTYAALDAVGKADTAELTLTYPFVRSQAYALEGSLNVGHRKLVDEIRSTGTVNPKTADVGTATLVSRGTDVLWGMPGQTTLLAAVTLGYLDIADGVGRTQDALGAGTAGRYGKVNLSLSRITPLQRNWTLVTALRLQHALFDKNLDGSEDMSISGAGSVKVYPPSEFAAENAALVNLELLYALPLQGPYSARVGVFADAGRASMQRAFGPSSDARTLSDAGLSLYAYYGNVFASLQVATRTSRAATSENVSATRTLLQLGTRF
ncbi:MAG: ShlB/FhaC/HecB family hemolysin secretion/activation protein [Pseudomonadota bacterium]|nr:ShlB/FhaC/HecB family hemolysin secretion/activation protein [Pseudomonadota bacterium]